MRMCLEEAQIFRHSLSCKQAVAPVVVNVWAPYYCRSTDAFAGNYLAQSKGFDTREAAQEYVNKSFNYDDHMELRIKILPHIPVAMPVYEVNEEDVPF